MLLIIQCPSNHHYSVLPFWKRYEEAIDVLSSKTSLFVTTASNETKNESSSSIIVPLKCSSLLPAARLKLLGSYYVLSSQFDQAMDAYKCVLSQQIQMIGMPI
jgi:hypothetical protein